MMGIIDLTRELIRFKTVHSRAGEIRQCAAYIEYYLKSLGVSCQRFEYGNAPALLALPHGEKTPVLLMSHLDVVDAPLEPIDCECFMCPASTKLGVAF